MVLVWCYQTYCAWKVIEDCLLTCLNVVTLQTQLSVLQYSAALEDNISDFLFFVSVLRNNFSKLLVVLRFYSRLSKN